MPGDLLQEHFNRLLEAIVKRKGKDFQAPFIREIVSHNLHQFGRVKKDMCEGVNLNARSAAHKDPHTKPETRTLLRQYTVHELHSFHRGREIKLVSNDTEPQTQATCSDAFDLDVFTVGWRRLFNDKLDKGIRETTEARFSASIKVPTADMDALGTDKDYEPFEEGLDDQELEDPIERVRHTLGSTQMVNGELVVEVLNENEISSQIVQELERDKDGSGSDSDRGE